MKRSLVFIGVIVFCLGLCVVGVNVSSSVEIKDVAFLFQRESALRSQPISEATAITGGVVIDGTGRPPIEDAVILIEQGKIIALGQKEQISVPRQAKKINAAGKYIIPGLLDGNVHLTFGTSIEYLARYEGRFEELAEEAAQVALKSGVTTVFDTWGPLQPLLNVRDRVNRGEVVGSRIFCAGNIIGFSGPLGRDFNPDSSASKMFKKRINALWEENVGPNLGFMTPDEVAAEIAKYTSRGPDFLKYGSSGHSDDSILLFSEEAQKAIIREGHKANLTVQCHTTNVESLRMAVEAGIDLITHCDITENEPIPDSTIKELKEKQIPCGVLPGTKRRFEANLKRYSGNSVALRSLESRTLNLTHLIRAGVPLVLTTDAGIWSPEIVAEMTPENKIDRLDTLGEGHFLWCQAMAEKGMSLMDIILCATRNVAAAYHKLDLLGTLEKGKIADLVILDANPLEDVNSLRKIFMVIKDGRTVERERLPLKAVIEVPTLE